MREFTTPALVTLGPHENLTDIVFRNAAERPDAVSFSRKVEGRWTDVTAREFAQEVTGLAKGLVAADVRPGDRVGLLAKTRYEWTLADFAILTAGAVTVPIYETSSAEQIAWNLADSQAVAVILENDNHLATYDEISSDVPGVRAVWQIDRGDLDALAQSGSAVADEEIARRRGELSGAALATILYTSGTTGRPKGCELTHGNLLFDAVTTTRALAEVFGEGSSTLLFLPLAHVFARVIQFGTVVSRARLGHTADVKNLLPDLAAFRPTFVLSVPRVFEKIYNGAKTTAQAAGAGKGKLFERADALAVRYSQALDTGRPAPLLTAQHALFDKVVYSRIRHALGGQVRYAVSGGAPLGARLGHFFRGAGIPVLEGYGLSETSAGTTLNLPDSMRIGTVGRPLPGVTVRIADDGEILVQGDSVFRGYWRNDAATRETLEPAGWFHTGDLGELDDDGFLRITGRTKEIIVTAGGKNVSPAVLEDSLRSHPLVSQCMVVGDQRPYVGALITLDGEALGIWKKEHAKPQDATARDLRDDPDLRATIEAAVESANRTVSRAEAIRAFRILDVDFTEEAGQLTPTLKVKRTVVAAEFAPEIDALYVQGR